MIVAIIGLGGLGAATAFRVVTRPGRELPPYDEKLRALRGPPTAADEEARMDAVRSDARGGADVGPPDAAHSRVAKRAPKRRRARPRAKKPAVRTPGRRPTVATAPRPTSQAIRACINQRRASLRRCVEQSALRMEAPPGGTGRAVLKPDGTLGNLRVPGGRYFSRCVVNVLGTLRCRPFEGAPIEVSYPLRW